MNEEHDDAIEMPDEPAVELTEPEPADDAERLFDAVAGRRDLSRDQYEALMSVLAHAATDRIMLRRLASVDVLSVERNPARDQVVDYLRSVMEG